VLQNIHTQYYVEPPGDIEAQQISINHRISNIRIGKSKSEMAYVGAGDADPGSG